MIEPMSIVVSKSLPVHCVVEVVSALEESRLTWRRKTVVETDSYVIIPVNTAFQELVQVALNRLGYPRDSASAAKGSVVIKNWKPLSFEKIADGPTVTVGDILGELTTVATLRIQLYRARPSVIADIKDKLLRLLLPQSHGLLVSTGCPLDEVTLAQLCRSSQNNPSAHLAEPNDECRRKFEQWLSIQLSQQQQHQPPHGPLHHSTPRPQSGSQYSPGGSSHHPPTPNKLLDRPPSLPESVHPALQTVQSQYPTQKTRMRTSFDPELELPKLQRWFAENQHPSRQQIQQYVKELNGLESRRGRKPLDINNVVYWFKNARAAQKRAELRGVGPGLPCHISLNGYNSSSHSPPHPGGMMLGQDSRLLGPGIKSPSTPLHSPTRGQLFLSDHHSDNSNDPAVTSDQEDEDDHRMDLSDHLGDPREDLREAMDPGSPTAPLSLTTNDKDTSGDSPKPSNTSEMGSIKQEPPDEMTSPLSNSNNNNNNNNNSSQKDCEDMSDVEEDDEEEEPEDLEERRNKVEMDNEEEIGTMHPARIGDLNRQQERLRSFRSPSPSDMIVAARGPPGGGPPNLDRLAAAAAGFPLVPNSMFSHSIMYMSHYIPGLAHQHHGHHGLGPTTPPSSSGGLNLSALAASADERRKRNRTFIDPVTEVPRLEQWFSLNTHPSHNLILKYTEELNRMPYRQKFPRLEPKNVQFWFKNRRAKCKRLKMSLFETPQSAAAVNHHQMPYPDHRE